MYVSSETSPGVTKTSPGVTKTSPGDTKSQLVITITGLEKWRLFSVHCCMGTPRDQQCTYAPLPFPLCIPKFCTKPQSVYVYVKCWTYHRVFSLPYTGSHLHLLLSEFSHLEVWHLALNMLVLWSFAPTFLRTYKPPDLALFQNVCPASLIYCWKVGIVCLLFNHVNDIKCLQCRGRMAQRKDGVSEIHVHSLNTSPCRDCWWCSELIQCLAILSHCR